jgi:hypothetical protein
MHSHLIYSTYPYKYNGVFIRNRWLTPALSCPPGAGEGRNGLRWGLMLFMAIAATGFKSSGFVSFGTR